MKRNIFKNKRFLILSVLIIIIISSCKKDDNGDIISPVNNDQLSIEFSQTLSVYYDYGWVVLYDISGRTITDFKKFEFGETVHFSNTSDKVSISMVLVDTTINNGILSIGAVIYSYLEAPAGTWTMSRRSYDNIGDADITLQYPEDQYDRGIVSTNDFIFLRSDIPPNELTVSTYVSRLQENQKYSIYGTVYKDTIGYCNWAMDQDCQLGQLNNYNLELNKPMSKKFIEYNKPLSGINLDGFYDGRESLYWLYGGQSESFQGNSNIGMLLIPDGLPMSEVRVRAYSDASMSSIAYTKVYGDFNDIPGNIKFPENSISANYDQTNKAISNIQISGTGDMIIGSWSYFDIQNESFNHLVCDVYADITHSILYKPVLPQQITNELGGMMNKLSISSINLLDFNTTENLSDFIYLHYSDDIPVYSRSDEYFSYSYWLNPTIAKNPRGIDMENGQWHQFIRPN